MSEQPSKAPAISAPESPLRGHIIRIGTAVVVALAIASVWWSLNRLRPVQKQVVEASTQLNRLSSEIQQMETRWSAREVEQVVTRHEEAKRQIIDGQTGVGTWISEIRQRAIPMALDLDTRLGLAATQAVADVKLAVIPATVQVQLLPATGVPSDTSPYQRVLRMSQHLVASEKRADLVELSVSGNSNSVSRALAVVNLWTGEENPQ